ncbi:MAG: hypothetical protein FJ388_03015, partial [Verrucomicrobia bacterium]|nr:hypothetical protein [Verrucomicrobiota bacterium]
CLRLDAKTGATKYTYTMPEVDEKRRRWAYVSVSNGVLVGSGSRTDISYGRTGPPLPVTTPSAGPKTNIVSDLLFAFDVKTGTTRWTWAGQAIPQASISVADGHVFFADGGIPTETKKEGPLTKPTVSNPMRKITSLDLNDGSVAWTKDVNLTGALGGKYFSTLGSIAHNGSLVLFGIYTDGHFWKDFFAGQFEQRRIVVLGAKDGSEQWSKNVGYRVRPIVVGDTLHAEPWAFDLKTGAQRTRVNPMTGREEPWQFARPGHHCGGPVATANMMAFRSLYLGYYDLTRDSGIMHFGGQRPGCWINFIFANGLLMMPEASSGCMCAFPIQCTTVFAPREEDRAWTKYSLSGDIKPVKHLALNLGAPGDRRDDADTMWIAYPRPAGSITSGLVLKYDATVTMLPQTRTNAYFAQSPDSVRVEGTRSPWLYTFGACGVSAIELPLLDPGDGTGRYTVRLGFAEMDNAEPGERVCDVWLQGKLALKDLDVIKQAGGPRRALVKEFKDVEVTDKLAIEFKPKAKQPTAKQAPILQTVEVIRERMLGLGVSTPSFQLNDSAPAQSAELRLANQTDAAFAGSLRVVAPAGLIVTPAGTPLKLAIGERMQVALNVAAAGKLKPAKYPVSLQLVRADGTIEAERKTDVEYLGPRGRMVVQTCEDAYVSQRGAADGRGRALLVDGGAKVMGDEHHAVAYLKFKLDVPGKPLSATLRIWNAGNATSNGGNICLVTGTWTEEGITYTNRPKPGEVLANLGRVESNQSLEAPLKFSPPAKGVLSLAIDPVNCDGVNYISREGGKPAELIVEYEK